MMVAVALAMLAGLSALGCGRAPSATSSPPTTASSAVQTPLDWVNAHVRTWNQTLNLDQDAVDVASAQASEVGAGAFFSRLKSTCGRLLQDATRAGNLPRAPSTQLDRAWRLMTATTERYASDCLTLVREQSNADFARWQASLTSMDAANAALNASVDAVRGAKPTPAA